MKGAFNCYAQRFYFLLLKDAQSSKLKGMESERIELKHPEAKVLSGEE
jgi:hypothetical protein